ncbi:hypothetical protein V2B37_13535 [Natranaerobius thermophilus JW/NM-WN-LF]
MSFMLFSIGCSEENKVADESDEKIAYISSNPESEYENTFNDLSLGTLFDFNFELLRADESWVKIWVEGYNQGEAVKPSPLAELSYGLYPEQEVEGQLGAGILHSDDSDSQILIYSKGARTGPSSIDKDIFIDSTMTSWGYAIGEETIGLKPGEEKLLAVYRQGEDELKTTYDYQDSDDLEKMINEDTMVLLLKIKVEEKEEL